MVMLETRDIGVIAPAVSTHTAGPGERPRRTRDATIAVDSQFTNTIYIIQISDADQARSAA